ncbi:hypothetical protein GCM10022224_068970 [Nonomuraea antimicrobica]|uniref:Uncharacterized protein n=1 Tax=Nonomuraea antimicrobica TaxID=561173 RepID=A0ABP7CS15_9ACTN
MADNIAPAWAADGPLGSRSSPALVTLLNTSAVSATAPTAAKIESVYATMKISRISVGYAVSHYYHTAQ